VERFVERSARRALAWPAAGSAPELPS
jgi:hypothetical protein